MLLKVDPTNSKACMSLLEDVTTNAKQIQDSVLEAVLSRNAQTEYLRSFLQGQVDKQSIKKKNLPVVTYNDRIANGELSNIICDQPITVLLTSSGTSEGVPILIRLTTEDFEQRLSLTFLHAALIDKESKTASGLMFRTMVSSYLKLARSYIWDRLQISPLAIAICAVTTQSMYCQLLCGLLERDIVARLGAPFAYSFLKIIKFLEDLWPEVCSNIKIGRVSDWITDPQCVSGISKFVTALNPELASLIEQECRRTSWEEIVKRQ